MKLSVVIPVYNEERTITILLKKVLAVLESGINGINDYEIVIVDDGSKDGTVNILKNEFIKHPKLSIYFQSENGGKGTSLRKGFSYCKGDIVLIQDADLEYDPNDYIRLIQPIVHNKADVVYGSRFKGEVTRILYFWHSLGNKFLTLVSNMFTNLNLSDMETCYKVFRRDLIQNLKLESKRFGIEPEITAKLAKIKGIRIYEVPVSYFGRTYSEGKKINWKDGFEAIWCIIKYNILRTKKDSFVELPVFESSSEIVA